MGFIVMIVVHVLVQKCFCSEDFVTEAAPPLNTMVSVPSSVLYVVPAPCQIVVLKSTEVPSSAGSVRSVAGTCKSRAMRHNK